MCHLHAHVYMCGLESCRNPLMVYHGKVEEAHMHMPHAHMYVHMPMPTHSAACAHVSDAPRWGRTMEAGDTEPHENWAKQLAVQKLMKLMLDSPEADHSDAVEGLRNEEPAERGYQIGRAHVRTPVTA